MIHQWIQNPAIFEALLVVLSISAGVFGAILGLGGGILIVPLLTIGFGINIHYAIGASIVSVIATSSGAAVAYLRDHVTNVRVAMLLEVATTLGALSGALLAATFSTSLLFLVFSLVLLLSAGMMLRKKSGTPYVTETNDWFAHRLRLNSSYPDHHLGQRITYAVTRVPLGFALMYGAGMISGMLGVGSGVLKVPAMDTAMRLPIKVSSATSSFMIGVTAAASAGAYYMKGDIIPMIAAPVALGVLIGAQIGTKIMMRMKNENLRKLFLVVLVVIAVQMGIKAFR